MRNIEFDNKMKSLSIDFFKAGLVMTGITLVASIIIYLFGGMDFPAVLILTGFIFIIFFTFGFIFLVQQKKMILSHSTVEITYIYKSKTTVIDLNDIKEVKIIHIGNYQPKIVIRTTKWRYTINCSNTTTNQSILNVKAYFKDKKIKTKYKDHGIRW